MKQKRNSGRSGGRKQTGKFYGYYVVHFLKDDEKPLCRPQISPYGIEGTGELEKVTCQKCKAKAQ